MTTESSKSATPVQFAGPNPVVTSESSWERYLKKLCRLLWVDREGNPFPFLTYTYDHRGNKYEQEIGFSDLSLEAKAEVVYHLCEYRLYAEDSSDLVAHLVDDELRVEPLGKDSRGNIYWYFFGTRLYRECPSAVDRVDQRRESIIRYRVKEALDQAKKAQQELLEKTKEQEKSVAGSAVAAAPAKKKVKHDPIPGERTSSRISKPVDRLNGHTLRETSSSSSAGHRGNSDTKKSSNSTNHHHHSNNKNPTNSRKQQQETPPDPSTSCGIPLTDLQSAWDCVCDHESEWESLTASFAKSKVPCEVDLFKILSKNFLPLIHEVAEKERREKEKEQKAKILELIPRRTSSRIEIKKIQQVEEEKREAEEREERKRRSAQAEERRKREDERVRQDEIKRQREERARQRLAILEDRAARAAIRKRPIDGPSNGLNEDHKILEEDEDVIDIADPDVTMILSNGWPPNE